MEAEGFCPISHIPLRELRTAVIFRGDPRVVYDAAHLTRWLHRYQARNPMTNAELPAGCQVADLLEPIRLSHMSEAHVAETARILEAQGRHIVESAAEKELREWVGIGAHTMVTATSLYTAIFMLKCILEVDAAAEQPMLSDECLWTPLVAAPLQIAGVAVIYWALPLVRRYMLALVGATLAMAVLVIGLVEALELELTPQDLRCVIQLGHEHIDALLRMGQGMLFQTPA